jgi:hypothetical protein
MLGRPELVIGVALLRRTRTGETAGHRRSRCADLDAVAPVAVDPVEAVLDVGAGLIGQQVAWEPGRGAVAEDLALCGGKMRLETVENRVRAGAGLQRSQHHDAQRHRTSVALRPRRARVSVRARSTEVAVRVAGGGGPRRAAAGLLGQQLSSPCHTRPRAGAYRHAGADRVDGGRDPRGRSICAPRPNRRLAFAA